MLRLAAAAALAAGAAAAVPCALSNVFGDHMVLQRGPQPAMVFGFAPPGTSVTTTFQAQKYTTPTGADGLWRQSLPAQPATASPQQISFSCSTGEAFALNDVLFGDVVLCGGQSNSELERPRARSARKREREQKRERERARARASERARERAACARTKLCAHESERAHERARARESPLAPRWHWRNS
jgi:hypothetical protein